MKLHGRITIYGEYLSTMGPVLSMPSTFFISDTPEDFMIEDRYREADDDVKRYFAAKGLKYRDKLYSNMVHGGGISSSTALAIMHAYANTTEPHQLKELVNESDMQSHGFRPSGLDFHSVYDSRPGIYRYGTWKNITVKPFPCLLIEVPKEHERELSEIKTRMLSSPENLVDIASALTRNIFASGELDFDLMSGYCVALLAKDVYSKIASKIATKLLENGFNAKCVGGLYDKMILVTSKSNDDFAGVQKLLDEFDCKIFNFPILSI